MSEEGNGFSLSLRRCRRHNVRSLSEVTGTTPRTPRRTVLSVFALWVPGGTSRKRAELAGSRRLITSQTPTIPASAHREQVTNTTTDTYSHTPLIPRELASSRGIGGNPEQPEWRARPDQASRLVTLCTYRHLMPKWGAGQAEESHVLSILVSTPRAWGLWTSF